MKTLLPDLICIWISFVACNLFCLYVKQKYGRRPSISNSAKYVQGWLFFAFAILSFAPLMYLARESYMSIISSGLLMCIGVITGWNPELKTEGSLQDNVHIGLTIGCIVVYAVGMIIICPYFFIPILFCAIISFFIWKNEDKIADHTWHIERILFHFVHGSWFVYYLIQL